MEGAIDDSGNLVAFKDGVFYAQTCPDNGGHCSARCQFLSFSPTKKNIHISCRAYHDDNYQVIQVMSDERLKELGL